MSNKCTSVSWQTTSTHLNPWEITSMLWSIMWVSASSWFAAREGIMDSVFLPSLKPPAVRWLLKRLSLRKCAKSALFSSSAIKCAQTWGSGTSLFIYEFPDGSFPSQSLFLSRWLDGFCQVSVKDHINPFDWSFEKLQYRIEEHMYIVPKSLAVLWFS